MPGLPPSPQISSRGHRAVWWAAAVLSIAVVAAYLNSLSGELVFDDTPAIRENATIRSLRPLSAVLSPPQDTGVGGRPLANLSFALNYALGGTAVPGYHAFNLALHLASALLLFGVLRRVAPLGRGHAAGADVGAVGFALAAALLWAVHPLTTSAVTYVSQRTEVLMATCYLATLYAFVRGVSGSPMWFGLSVAACACGMASKEVMVTAPIVVLLFDRTFVAGTFRAAWRQRSVYYLALASTWLLLGYLLTTGLHQRSMGFGHGVSAMTYALTEARALLRYLALAVWPAPLVFDYGPVYSRGLTGSLLAGAVLLALVVRSAVAMRRGSAGGLAVVCFFVVLAPTSSFVPVAEQPIAENRMYLPLAFLVSAGAGMAAMAIRDRGVRRVAVVLVGLAFGVATHARNNNYRTALGLWTDTVAKRPENVRAHFNQGVLLLERGRAAEAAVAFENALRVKPELAEADNSRGNALLMQGQVLQALPHYAEAVRLQPNFARAWYNYGRALAQQGDLDGAVARLQEALRHAPDLADAHMALGNVEFQRNQPARAVPHYVRALEFDPRLADAAYSCGSALFELGKYADAIGFFARAARLKPRDAEVRNFLGAALLRAGHVPEAIGEFEHALRLDPNNADVRTNLELARAARK